MVKAREMLVQTHLGSWVLLVLSLWKKEKGSGAKSTSDKRNRERPPYCYSQSHPFSSLCCDHLVSTAQCLELLGQRGLYVSVITPCSASDPWCVCKETKSMYCFDSLDIKSHVESKKQFAMWHRVTCPAVFSDLYPNEKPSYKHLPEVREVSCKHMLSA